MWGTLMNHRWVGGVVLLMLSLVGCRGEVPQTPPSTTTPTTTTPAQPVPAATSATKPAGTAAAAKQTEPEDFLPESTTDETPYVLEDGFQPLTLADFVPFPAGSAGWSEAGDKLLATGKPKGYLASRDSFENFTWRLELRYPRPKSLTEDAAFKGNTGFLVYMTGEPKIWPICLEVQGKHVQLGAIKENGGAAAPVVQHDPAVRDGVLRPVGTWNEMEIVSKGGALTVTLNGTVVATSEPNFLSSGSIGIQAEDHPFELRRVRIRRDP